MNCEKLFSHHCDPLGGALSCWKSLEKSIFKILFMTSIFRGLDEYMAIKALMLGVLLISEFEIYLD